MKNSTKRRNERLELRLTPAAKAMLRRAAEVENKTISSFVLDKGLEAAAASLADRHEFPLDPKHYDAFLAAPDAPARPRPRLEKLLTSRSALE